MAETIRQAVGAAGMTVSDIAAIGVATPGTMDIKHGLILDPPNLKPWQNVPVRDHIATGVRQADRLPERRQRGRLRRVLGRGRAKDVESMVMFTLGTGIGGGIILDDKVLEGQHSHGGEVGHMKIDLGKNRQCGCGRWGCLEAYASATAVVKRAQEAVAAISGPSLLRDLLADDDEELPAKVVFEAAAKGDVVAAEVRGRHGVLPGGRGDEHRCT